MIDSLPILCAHLDAVHGIVSCDLHGICAPARDGVTLSKQACPDFHRAYRRGEKRAASPLMPMISCDHLGKVIRQDGECSGCSSVVSIDVHGCAIHGECTERVPLPAIACCAKCPDHVTKSSAQMVVSADGVGDHLMACAIAAAWKRDNPGRRLHLVVRHRQWIELFQGAYDSCSAQKIDGVLEIYPELTNRGNSHFVQAAAAVPAHTSLAPRPLSDDAIQWAETYRGCVVLVPLSLGSGAGRNWLMSHWLVLERLIGEQGIPVVVIGAGTDAERLAGFRSKILAGEPANHVAALMKAARVVVSNESGMGHLAGAIGVPAVVLAAQLDGRLIYRFWPSVQVIQGPLSCSGCNWSSVHYRPACDTICACLQAIDPAVAMAAIQPFLDPPDAAYVPDTAMDADLKGHLSKLVVPVATTALQPFTMADRRATMRAFVRHIVSRPNMLVVETGCQRADLDYGAGMSTTIFGLALAGHGGKLVSLDNSPPHVEFCRARTKDLPVEVVLGDSRDFLRSYSGQPIAALYLDSQDTWEPGHADCNLEEASLAMDHLADDALILIDDTWRSDGQWHGKGTKTIPWLLARGWRVRIDSWQVLLERDR